ncbi:hypothetical protein BKG75_16230 [Mycobacteroides chelonae]|nr:hypothetical protein BKG75_16230 [Mycobacteroides chelonae]
MICVAAVGLGTVAVMLAPGAAAQPCQSPGICQNFPPRRESVPPTQPRQENTAAIECRASVMAHVCTEPGNAQLQSWPNPAVIPPVPVTIPPWQVLGAPGEGRFP